MLMEYFWSAVNWHVKKIAPYVQASFLSLCSTIVLSLAQDSILRPCSLFFLSKTQINAKAILQFSQHRIERRIHYYLVHDVLHNLFLLGRCADVIDKVR